MNKLKLIIFDLDGVLVEAKNIHYDALNEALGKKYEIGLKEEKVDYLYSKKKRNTANRHLFDFNYTRLRENYVHFFRYSWKN